MLGISSYILCNLSLLTSKEERETMDKDQVIKAVKDQDIKFIRLWFTDVVGTLKSFA